MFHQHPLTQSSSYKINHHNDYVFIITFGPAALLGLMTYLFTWLSWQQIIIEKMIVRCKYYARS